MEAQVHSELTVKSLFRKRRVPMTRCWRHSQQAMRLLGDSWQCISRVDRETGEDSAACNTAVLDGFRQNIWAIGQSGCEAGDHTAVAAARRSMDDGRRSLSAASTWEGAQSA